MAPTLIPYGRLAGGNYGLLINPSSNQPLASAMEVLRTLPVVARPDNFDGRLVFITSQALAYAFRAGPTPGWVKLTGNPATLGHVAGNPPTRPNPTTGALFFDQDRLVLFLWDSAIWQPVGGYYARQFIVNTFVGDGTTVSFPTGAIGTLTAPYVEVSINGARQVPTADYTIAGTNVVFGRAPPNAVNIFIRSVVQAAFVQSAQIIQANYIATAAQTDFSTNTAGSDPNSVLVFVNGILKTITTNYTVVQQNTTIVTLAKTISTTARATTTAPHGMLVGQAFTIVGTNQAYYNASFVVSNVFSTTAFDFSVSAGAASSATGNPTMAFTPPAVNDLVHFITPMVGGEVVQIKTFRSVTVGPNANTPVTITNIGAGTPLVLTPVGSAYKVRSLVATAPLSLARDATTATISLAISTTATELNQLHGASADTADFTKLHAITVSAAELNSRAYDIPLFTPGVPGAGALVAKTIVSRNAFFPVNLVGSFLHAGTAATASRVYAVLVNGAGVGTITVAPSGTTGTFSMASAQTLVPGDKISITAPNPADATLANVRITLVGTRLP